MSLISVIGQTKCLATYFSMMLIYRSQRPYQLGLLNIALCVVYSSDSVSMFYNTDSWFNFGKLLIWSSLILGLVHGQALINIQRRLWEHICILLILKKKCDEEVCGIIR